MSTYGFVAKGLFISVLGLWLLDIVYGTLRSIIAARWPKTSGEVIFCEIQEDCDSDGSCFTPAIEFKYKINNNEYTSKKFAFGFVVSGFRFLSSGVVNRYKNKACVEVSFNPKQPAEGVLLTGIHFFHVFNIALFVVLILLINKYMNF